MLLEALKLTLIYFVVFFVFLGLVTFLSGLVTRYSDWKEIAEGNTAAAVILGSKLLGVAVVVRTAILTNPTLVQALMWGAIGTVLLLVTYILFELVTPGLNVNDEVAKGNMAVAVICAALLLAVSMVVAACIA